MKAEGRERAKGKEGKGRVAASEGPRHHRHLAILPSLQPKPSSSAKQNPYRRRKEGSRSHGHHRLVVKTAFYSSCFRYLRLNLCCGCWVEPLFCHSRFVWIVAWCVAVVAMCLLLLVTPCEVVSWLLIVPCLLDRL